MAGKVKVVGYSQRVFYDNNIEYRNFSDSLVGNQLTNDSGELLFNAGAFNVTINNDDKLSKTFKTNQLSDYFTLNDLNITKEQSVVISNTQALTLNLDKTKLSNYAYFGSLREFVRVSLEHIITAWPASICTIPKKNGVTYYTVEDYTYDNITDTSTFKVNVSVFDNKYSVSFTNSALVTDKLSTDEYNRSLTSNYTDYVISNATGDFNVLGYTGSTNETNDYSYLHVNGNPFTGSSSVFYHIKPNNTKLDIFLDSLNEFEKYILNRNTVPLYTSRFTYNLKTDNGIVLETEKELTWPTEDGYNLDFNTTRYVVFANDLLTLADNSDSIQSNIISRFLVSDSISEFDTVSEDNDSDTDQKVDKLLKIYGRNFDEIKRYTDGLSLVNTVTYDKQDNTPDTLLKSLGRVLGWDVSSSMLAGDILNSNINTTQSSYSGQSVGMTNYEAENEVWRRIILNTPWIWKSKGSRKAIEFFFKFLGIPNGLIRFNEHIYLADSKLNMDDFLRVLEIHSGSQDISNITVDSEGYPKPLPDTKDMYFQKAGLWYRQTGGAESDTDILYGNNPHIGPYDGGNEYIDKFRCLIPNFSTTTLIEEVTTTGSTNLFMNYDNGYINGIIDSNSVVLCDTLPNYVNILNTGIHECLLNSLTQYKCADGYTLSTNYDSCVKITEKNNTGFTTTTVLQGDVIVGTSLSTNFFENITNKFELPIIHIPTSANTDNLYDKNGEILVISGNSNSGFWGNNRLQASGVKLSSATEYNGFSIHLTLPESAEYYMGLGCYGYSKVFIDDDLIIDFSNINNFGVKQSYYSDWHVIPYTFTSGEHYITFAGKNISDYTGSLGFELYSANTLNDLIISGGNSNIMWSTSGKTGNNFDVNLGTDGTLIDGYSYDTTLDIFRKLDYVQIYGAYENNGNYSYVIDWSIIISLDNDEIYIGDSFFTGDGVSTPTDNDYIGALQIACYILNLELLVDNTNITMTSKSTASCDPNPYSGKTLRIEIDLKVNMVNNNMI